jgi:hypothetical protein
MAEIVAEEKGTSMVYPNAMDVTTREWWETRIVKIFQLRRQALGDGASNGSGYGADVLCVHGVV